MDTGTAIPAELTVRLTQDGTTIPGAVDHETFSASSELATVTMSVPFRVDSVPVNVEVVSDQSGFTFTDISLTVLRLGDS